MEVYSMDLRVRVVPSYRAGEGSQAALADRFKREHSVVLDRLSSHRDPEVARAVRRTGAKFWHLPPCSHDLNPIEQMWAKVKARDIESLITALGDARRPVTAKDAQGWFR